VRAAAEGAVVALAGTAIALQFWTASPDRKGIAIGTFAAWAASSASVAWLLWARGRSSKAFWWAFGGGMVLRAVVLAALVVFGYGRKTVTLEPLLISYVFALLGLLLTLEMRHLKIR
jgi:hypothetical protein